jgi:hypothetical protein
MKLDMTYFSDLVRTRRSQVRQFVFFTYTAGLNRQVDKTIELEGKWSDENGVNPLGDERLTLGFETVYFMPWFLYGFQFAAYHRIDLSLLTYEGKLFSQDSFFPALKAGVRFFNDYLVLPSFSMELGYYGRNDRYSSKWEFRIATTLPDLFGTNQVFKPRVRVFE